MSNCAGTLSQATRLSDLYALCATGRKISRACYMASADSQQAFWKEVCKLKLRNEELDEENRILRDICNKNGVQFKDRLAAHRHNRYFAHLCAKHPIESTAGASDVMGAANLVRGIAGYAGAVLRTGLIARCFFAAFKQLTAQLPWTFGGRLSATFEGHRWVANKSFEISKFKFNISESSNF